MTETLAPPICKTVNCKKELTWQEGSECWRCLTCNPISDAKPAPPKTKKYVDVAMTESRVREIVRDELENWHIQKPPVTRDEIAEATGEGSGEVKVITVPEKLTWRQQAKELGIELFHRKKEDVLADIARLTEGSPAGDVDEPPATVEKGI